MLIPFGAGRLVTAQAKALSHTPNVVDTVTLSSDSFNRVFEGAFSLLSGGVTGSAYRSAQDVNPRVEG